MVSSSDCPVRSKIIEIRLNGSLEIILSVELPIFLLLNFTPSCGLKQTEAQRMKPNFLYLFIQMFPGFIFLLQVGSQSQVAVLGI